MNELRRRRSSFASRRRRRGKLRPRLRLLPPLKSATSPAPTLFRRPHVWRRKNLSSLCRLVCSSSMKSSWGHGVCACVVRSTSTKQMIVRTNSHSFSPSSPTHSICPSDFALSVEAPKLSVPFCFCLAYILLPFCLLHCSSFRPHIHIQRSPLSHSRRLSSSRPEHRVQGSSFEEEILPLVAFTTDVRVHAYTCGEWVWEREERVLCLCVWMWEPETRLVWYPGKLIVVVVCCCAIWRISWNQILKNLDQIFMGWNFREGGLLTYANFYRSLESFSSRREIEKGPQWGTTSTSTSTSTATTSTSTASTTSSGPTSKCLIGNVRRKSVFKNVEKENLESWLQSAKYFTNHHSSKPRIETKIIVHWMGPVSDIRMTDFSSSSLVHHQHHNHHSLAGMSSISGG